MDFSIISAFVIGAVIGCSAVTAGVGLLEHKNLDDMSYAITRGLLAGVLFSVVGFLYLLYIGADGMFVSEVLFFSYIVGLLISLIFDFLRFRLTKEI